MRTVECFAVGIVFWFAAACSSGDGGSTGTGGAGTGGSGGDGSIAVACRQKVGADMATACAGHAGKPRKLDCDPAQTQEALNAGCEVTGPEESDVCCPTMVSGAPG